VLNALFLRINRACAASVSAMVRMAFGISRAEQHYFCAYFGTGHYCRRNPAAVLQHCRVQGRSSLNDRRCCVAAKVDGKKVPIPVNNLVATVRFNS